MIAQLFFLLIVAAAIWAIGKYLLPDPAKNIATWVAVVIVLIAFINFVFTALGYGVLIPLHVS